MINKETEYKYMIYVLPNLNDSKKYKIKQSYFEKNEKTINIITNIFKNQISEETLNSINTFRIREIETDKTRYVLTLKTKGLNTRMEYEEEVSPEIGEYLKKISYKTIIKNRYVIFYETYKFEFDEYLNLCEPLLTVEVETEINKDNKENIERILKKHFKLEFKDITNEKKYKNKYLITKEK